MSQSAAQSLPPDFTFSQSSLQTYADCPRRFWHTYIQRLPWPAVEATPVQEHELLMRLGHDFHRLVQRAEIGMDPEQLAQGLADPLALWLDGYRRYRPQDLPTTIVEVEYALGIHLELELDLGAQEHERGDNGEAETGIRTDATAVPYLTGLFDLLAVDPGERAVILDWKTTRRRPDPNSLRRRLQTQVYPYILVEASKSQPWGPLQPEQVEMRYWFTAAPDLPSSFPYDAGQHAATHDRLQQLLGEIQAGRTQADYPKVPDTPANRRRFCSYCTYRSRCDRGERAGSLEGEDSRSTHESGSAIAEAAGHQEYMPDAELILDTAFDAAAELDFNLDDVQELAF